MRITARAKWGRRKLLGVLSEKDSQYWAGPKKTPKAILDEVIKRNTDQLVKALVDKDFNYGEIHASQRFGGSILRTVSRDNYTKKYEFFSPGDFSSLGVFRGRDDLEALENMIRELGAENLPQNNDKGDGVSHKPGRWDHECLGGATWDIHIQDMSEQTGLGSSGRR